jgi:hypothetical protein
MDIIVEVFFVTEEKCGLRRPPRQAREGKSKCSAIRNLVSAAPQKWAGLVATNCPPPCNENAFRFTNAAQFLAECSV